MTIQTAIAGLMLPFVSAWLILRYAMPGGGAAALERAGAALAFAVGASSTGFFLWRLAGGSPEAYGTAELIILGLITAGLLYRGHPAPGGPLVLPRPRVTVAAAATSLLTIIVLATSATAVAENFAALPHGAWDAWAIWNLRAAFLANPTAHWLDGFADAVAHPDYPLLVPSAVARLWVLNGDLSTMSPVVVASEMYVATVLVLAGTLWRVSAGLGAAAGLALLLVPEYASWVASQCADVPLGLYILLSVSLLSEPSTAARLAASGAAAGLAAWTKNEGLVAAVGIPLLFAVITARRDGGRAGVRRTGWILAGLAPCLAVLVLFKVTLAPPSDLMRGIPATGPAQKALDLTRHGTVASYMAGQLAEWGHWRAGAPIWFVVALLAVGLRRLRQAPVPFVTGIMVVAFMLLSYYVVYVLTPHDLMWHLQTSWRRLIVQFWPTLLWAAVASALAPIAERR